MIGRLFRIETLDGDFHFVLEASEMQARTAYEMRHRSEDSAALFEDIQACRDSEVICFDGESLTAAQWSDRVPLGTYFSDGRALESYWTPFYRRRGDGHDPGASPRYDHLIEEHRRTHASRVSIMRLATLEATA